MEVFAEKTITGRRLLVGTRLGRYRTPFGISNRSDHGYTGFLRAPLIRYGGYWALSNNFLETGASVVAGTPRLQAEVSLGIPQDEDVQRRRRGFDRVVRLQTAVGDVHRRRQLHPHAAVGAARLRAGQHRVPRRSTRRWMMGGVQVRGEWIDGRSFAGTRTYGGYADLIVHRPFMGPVTAVARAEKLDYLAGRLSSYPRRYTAGARVRLASMLVAHVNAIREPAYDLRESTDVAGRGPDLHGTALSRFRGFFPPVVPALAHAASRRGCCSFVTLVTARVGGGDAGRGQSRHHVQRARTQRAGPGRGEGGVRPADRTAAGVCHEPEPADHRAADLSRASVGAAASPATTPPSKRWPSSTGGAPASDFLLVADRSRHVAGAGRTGRAGAPNWSLLTQAARPRTPHGHSALVAAVGRRSTWWCSSRRCSSTKCWAGWPSAIGSTTGSRADLARVTHADVNLIAGGRLWASSLDPAPRAAVAAA